MREIHTAYETAGHVVGYTNLSILVDLMTMGGNIISIDRHGINKTEIDVLGRASFESTVEQIITAGLFGEIDSMKGVSSRMIGGLVIKGGTGFCDVILDTNMIQKSEYNGENKYRSYTDIVSDVIAKDIINNDVKENMFIPM
jgi:DNA-directed RNA polymerase beta' subunit